jgi:hypothetical protein
MTIGSRREWVGAWLLLAGLTVHLIGLAWDLQWHADVGPDFFFTAPHSVMYAGTAMIGLTSVMVVMLNTWAPTGRSVTVLRFFRAPLPFLIAGLGASGDLLYGAADLWWHEVYGFDVSDLTPSHLGLFLSTEVAAAGVVMAFAALSRHWAAACGLAVATAVALLLTDTEMAQASSAAGLAALALGLVFGVTRRSRWLVATGLAFAGVATGTYLFSATATPLYADLLGLTIRDYAHGVPVVSLVLAVALPVAAALSVAVVSCARRHDVRPAYAMAVAGGLTGLCCVLAYAAAGSASSMLSVESVAAVVLGAGLAAFGWQCAALLRRLAVRAEG